MPSVVIADEHPIVRTGLRTLLESEAGISVIGEAGDGIEALRATTALRPEVLILGLMLPGLSGLEVTRQVSQRSPRTRIVILSMYSNESYVVDALRAGALAYVLKKSATEHLIQAIRHVLAGRRYLTPPLTDQVLASYLERLEAEDVDPYNALTTREREVFHLVAEGHSSAAIATRLGISPRTVEMHRANMMRKLNISGHGDLVRYAVERGMLPPVQA